MGTIGSSLSSSSASSSSTTAPVTVSGSNNSNLFTGTSQYSSDFQNVISRAVAIADLPIGLLQTQQSALSAQNNELGTLDTLFNKLQTAVQGIETSLGGSSFQTSLLTDSSSATAATDDKAVSVTVGDGAAEGLYAIKVDNVGTYATSLSTQNWNAPAVPPGALAYSLVIGSKSYSVTAADNSAASVASAINAQYGDLVNATVVNLSSTQTGISLQSATLGPETLDIQAGLQQQTAAQGGETTSVNANTWNSTAATTSYNVVAGSKTYSISPASNNITDVIDAINGIAGNPVTATQVNLGSSTAPDYRIQLRSTSSGPLDIQPSTPISLQTQQQPPGQQAAYEVGNSGVIAHSSSRDITISPGITATLNSATDKPVNITVTRSGSALDTALSTFTDAYNAVVDELAKQRGQSGGPLQGLSITSSLTHALTSIATYSDGSSGDVNSLATYSGGLGLSLGTDGHLTYNEMTFLGTDLGESQQVTSFFGSSATGGFLKAANDILNGLENATSDPNPGLIKTSEAAYTTQITNIGTRISTQQDKVSAMQLQMQNQLAQSDALIASMEQQYTYLTDMFAAQDTASKAYSA